MECLDDNAVNEYVERKLTASELLNVEEHLADCDRCLTIACAAAKSDAPAVPPTIGRYRPIELIGQGAMGSVYLAHDPELDRDVALKLVRSERRAQPAMQARLAREARAMAKLRHPNVVAIHDVGATDDAVFLAMELVDGETLRAWLDREPRPWREIVRALVSAGRGLAAAHAAGIVHRDFKPENVLVEPGGRIAVGDFGIAALAHEAAESTSGAQTREADATNTGALLGTPRYMSPEQFRGERVDARTDQFSFAVALYEALYRARPFAGETPESLARAVIAGVLASPPRSGVPRRVHRVIARALATDREERFASITELLDALETAARPRWGVAAAAAAVVAAGALAVALAGPRSEAPPAPAGTRSLVLVALFENRTGNADLDDSLDAVVGTVLQVSTRVDPVFGASLRATAMRFHLEGADVDAIAAKYAGDPRPIVRIRGNVERDGAGYRVSLDAGERFTGSRTAPTVDALVPATASLTGELLAALGDPTTPPVRVLSDSIPAIHLWITGEHRSLVGDHAGAADRYQRALALDGEFVQARADYGLTLYNLQRKGQAADELERAQRGADRIPERQRLTLLGDYYGTIGRYSEAIMAYQQLLVKWPADPRTQINLTATAIDSNSWPLALEVARAAAADHREIEIARRNLVVAELANEKIADAIAEARDLLAKHPKPSGAAVTALASALALAGHREEARAAVAQVATYDAGLAPHALADFAAYVGRLDDAAAAVASSQGETDQLVLAWIELRRGDRAGAARAAKLAAGDASMPGAYLAASASVAAGDLDGADAKVAAWTDAPETDRRMYAQLLAGDLAMTARRWSDAIAAYERARQLGDAWIIHDRLARSLLGSGAAERAERELQWCLDHRGQAALVAGPSLALVPELYLLLARSREARRANPVDIRAAYQSLADLAPAAQHDPWTDEARARLAAPGRVP